jgi:hypothetical protein
VTRTEAATRCCPAWDALGTMARAEWAWQVLHQLSHSDVPFSAGRFAELARVDDDTARELIAYARRRRWITRVGAARKGHDARWRGVLDRPDHRHCSPARGT